VRTPLSLRGPMRIINILRRLRSSILDIYGQLAIGHVHGLKEARSSALKLEIRLERRARETGGVGGGGGDGGGVCCMPQGIGLAACFCCLLPPIGWPLFRNLAEISRNDHCWPPPQRRWPRSSCSCTPVHTRLTSPCAFEIAVARFPRQYLVQ
jgi:hypothetical protein